ncbi:SDR family NAD(P)-dependent oxidoreductase [Oceanobacillus polygoni]|uniref:NAD(P)-dependent dehydrogenase (Short-subunit alcohol dehydrogenase family) n=1 Tax=Oceanobacillus polygoni TaxID=1235259 RepID=A0A9X1CAQ1_9BACI|nr:glucose 1-dehydrogenase [Oceanobacillus polygoni]MBP2076091.1 NAD(P)-dependent dehydrogenase (short-subunit alcohol dehydrogenase family) [Oceanobacillus polygoni]
MELNGKTAVVTGSAKGIGKAIAEKLAIQGANIAVVDMDEESSRDTVLQLKNFDVKVSGYFLDLKEVERIKKLYLSIIDDFGSFDIVVNAAGIIKVNKFLEVTPDDWDVVMDLNAKSLFFSMQEAAINMIKHGKGGRIINISSITGKASRPDYPVYAASKASIISTTRSAATALAKYKINVNAVCPGYVHTSMWDHIDDHYVSKFNRPKGEVIEKMLNSIPLQRSGELHEIASLVAYLASSEASYITGQAINVDGGAIMY